MFAYVKSNATALLLFSAESKGFEPLIAVTLWRFSKPLPSTARPTFRILFLGPQKYKKSLKLKKVFLWGWVVFSVQSSGAVIQ